MKILRVALLALGIAALWLTVRAVGLSVIVSELLRLRGWVIPLFSIYALVYAVQALGWTYAYPAPLPKKVLFRDVYAIRIVGETLNAVIPWSASLGGEPLKAELLKRRHGVPLAETYASILIVHTAYGISLASFVLAGIWLNLETLPLPHALGRGIAIFLASMIGIVALLIAGLRAGLFEKLHLFLDKIGRGGVVGDTAHKIARLDGEIRRVYSDGKKRYALCVSVNFLGWASGILEVIFGAALLGLEIGWREAWLIEALIQSVRMATFFIPASVGAQEGAIVYIFTQLGFAQAPSVAFAVLRRVREIVWLAIGLFLWGIYSESKKH